MDDNYYDNLKEFCRKEGADLFGVADIDNCKNDFVISAPALTVLDRAVSIGVRLSSILLEDVALEPSRLYFHHYKTTNTFLDLVALKTSHYIERAGFKALPVPATQIVDWKKQTAHLSHKKIGVMAGIGWIGRNNLLVNEELGSRIRLATVLTDMPLVADKPVENGCGECRACAAVCPGAAIGEDAAVFSHTKCFEKMREFQKPRQVEQYVCGVCVNACKGNIRI